MIDEIQLVGSRCGPFAPAIDALERRAVDVSSLIEETLPLSRAGEALERASHKGTRKILIDCLDE